MRRASLFTTFCALALLRCTFGQVTSNIVGTLTDPDNAVVPNVEVQLTHQATGAVRTTSSTSVGIFRFTQLMPGDYTVTIKAAGFKAYSHTDIVLAASETRDLGNIRLALGASVEQISVTADATPVQTASSEKSVLVDAGELRNIAIRGRDVFAMLAFLPGIIDTNATSRDSETAYNIQGIAINGNTSWINAALDGQTNVGIGSGNITQGAPNMDAVQEVKVLSSNYQAEYGRNSGGTISLVTKSGSKEFHGSAFWTHRHEQFNANSWNNNRNNTRKSAYRYNVAGWSLGGPVFIPGHFNTQKTKLFFFASQEFTRQFLSSSLGKTTVPTTLERNGDFSQSFNINGSLIVIKDPTTGKAFPNNVIPPSSVNAIGAGFLKFLPAPNYTPAPGSPDYLRYNYAAENTGQHPRDNHVIRADTYLTNKLSGFVRFVRNSDSTALPFGGNSFLYASQVNPMPDFVFGGSLGYAISPTMYNEITAGRAASTWDYWITDPKQVARGLIPGLPKLFPITYSEANQLYEYLPAFSFGGTPGPARNFSGQWIGKI